MKNRKGSVLVLVFMVFVVLSILAITSISLMLTNNNQALAHRNKIQAYYIARGGAEATEAAILKMDDGEIKSLDEALKKPEGLNVDNIAIGSGEAQVKLSKDEKGNIEIESKGIVGKERVGQNSETVNKVIEIENNTSEEGGKLEEIFDLAVFSNTNMIFEANTQNNITGNIGTNSLKNSAIKFTSGYNKNITIKIPFGSDPLKIIEKPSYNDDIPVIEYIKNRNYIQYEFPEYPTNLTNGGSIKTNWNNSNPIIGSSAYYERITIDQNYSLTIKADERDIILRIKDFDVSQGNINISGNKNVKIFIENFISLKGKINENKINENKINENVEIYYNGDKDINIMDETKINSSIYFKNAGLKLAGGGFIKGNIVSGGSNISIEGRSRNHGLIYAPNAKIKLQSGGEVEGAIICNDFSISGNGSVKYNIEYIKYNPIILAFTEKNKN